MFFCRISAENKNAVAFLFFYILKKLLHLLDIFTNS